MNMFDAMMEPAYKVADSYFDWWMGLFLQTLKPQVQMHVEKE